MPNSIFLSDGYPFSGQMVGPAADNTAAPPFTFLNDLNTGYASSAADTLDLVTGGTSRWRVTSSGHLVTPADNSYDIGASAATRPRTLYLGTSLGVAAAPPNGTHIIYAKKDQDTTSRVSIENASAGTSALASFYASNGGADVLFGVTGSGSTGFPGIGANAPLVRSSGSLWLGSSGAGTVRFFASDVETARVTASGSYQTRNSTNGQVFDNVLSLTELTTIAAAATTTTTIQMPANSVVLGVSVRVTTVIPDATSFSVGDAGSATRFSTANVSTAANSTDPGTKAGAYYNATAAGILLTMNGGTPAANTGRVRVTIYYYSVTPPTS